MLERLRLGILTPAPPNAMLKTGVSEMYANIEVWGVGVWHGVNLFVYNVLSLARFS